MDPLQPPPLVYRVLRQSVQRVPPTIQSLNSHGCYLIIRKSKKQLLLWVGVYCEEEDESYAKKVAENVLERDFHRYSGDGNNMRVATVTEKEEPDHILDMICDLFWSDRQHYADQVHSKMRKSYQGNSSISVGFIDKVLLEDGSEVLDFQETCFAHPDGMGKVPRVPFVPIEPQTVAYINTGDVWELWFAHGVSSDDRAAARSFLEKAIINELNIERSDFKEEILAQLVHEVHQYQESVLFSYGFIVYEDLTRLPERPREHVPSEEEWVKHKRELEDKDDAEIEERYHGKLHIGEELPSNINGAAVVASQEMLQQGIPGERQVPLQIQGGTLPVLSSQSLQKLSSQLSRLNRGSTTAAAVEETPSSASNVLTEIDLKFAPDDETGTEDVNAPDFTVQQTECCCVS